MSLFWPGLLVWLPLLSLPVPHQSDWQLVWSDEFNGPANSAPDTSKWSYDLGATGWGNNELENYTDSLENAHLDGKGNLVIRAVRTAAAGYTSARLKTQGKFAVMYGKIEARMKIPFGHGVWPAFWMLGSDFDTAGWPKCGEIDIMENIGGEPSVIHGSLHGPGYSGSSPVTSTFTLPAGQVFSSEFHTYSVVWTPEGIEYYVDDLPYLKVSPATIPAGTAWVFTKPFFLLLNVAVGGNWPGTPDSTTQFPQELVVDYVRVYKGVNEPATRAYGVPTLTQK